LGHPRRFTVIHRIVGLRVSERLGPARIAFRLGLTPSTVHAVLRRYGCPRLAHLDRAAGVPVRRYERDRPGELVHADVKKLGNIPDGGGWRVNGKAAGQRNRRSADPRRNPNLGYGYLHTALDDHSRLACTEILAGERKETAAGFLARAHAWYAAAGITIERVHRQRWLLPIPRLGRYLREPRHHTQADQALPAPDQRQSGALPPHLADEWAYARRYASETERRAALDPWLHTYNHHREHTALKGQPPASRVTNLSGQNS
jgi:hypothetical protein